MLKGSEIEEDAREEIVAVVNEWEEEDNRAISLHDIKGVASNKIITVEGKVQEGTLMVLIDNGSTHSFLDENTTKKLNCRLTGTQPLTVTVDNGNKVLSNLACAGFC